MVFKKIYILLFLMSFVAGMGDVKAQKDPYAKINRVTLFESLNDSADLSSNFYSLDDNLDAAEDNSYFTEYESFDMESIHYPKFDFSNKTDTTFLNLLTSGVYVHPADGHVTSRFGPRRYRYHYGIDLKVYTGDPIYSIFDGVVRIAKRSSTYGYIVIVRHYNGLETYYAHLSKLEVESDQVVKAGDLIGLGGNTGRSRGSHLHFEVRYLGAPINPEDIIDFENRNLIAPTLNLCAHNFRYLDDLAKVQKTKYHAVRKGETLSAISRKYRTSVSAIARLNGISTKSTLRTGQQLRVR